MVGLLSGSWLSMRNLVFNKIILIHQLLFLIDPLLSSIPLELQKHLPLLCIHFITLPLGERFTCF